MRDDIKSDREKDSSIDTDLDLGSLDDIELDFPIDGDIGVEKGKGRKPTSSSRKRVSDFIKSAAKGVASGAKDAIYREIPDTRIVASGVSDTLSDIQSLRDDLSKQLAPLGVAIETAGRKFLPKIEKALPKTTYQKIKKRLEDRAAIRKSTTYTPRSQAEIDAETVRNELTALFGAQAETQLETARVGERNVLIDRTLGSVRHKQTTMQLVHLYDAVRATELFHKTQHMSYMKKSLELKYKHVFIARDTYNLLRHSLSVNEGYMKAIVDNTALPDMMKQKATDYIYGSRTKSYGTMMSSALGGLRKKVIDHLKQVKDNVTSAMGIATDGLNMYNDMSDLEGGMMGGGASGASTLGKAAGYLGGYFGLGGFMRRHAKSVSAINTRLSGIKGSMATKLSDFKRRADISTNPLMNVLGALLPDAFSQQTAASNDLVKTPDKAVPFDVITRQSITEIIPGYLGKIWHEIAMMRTGDENLEEQVYNVYERRFTGTSAVRKAIEFQAYGSEEVRRNSLSKMIGTLQAGTKRNRGTEESFDEYKKDINQVFVNYAVNTVPFRPEALTDFVMGGTVTPDIAKIIDGLDHPPREVLSKIINSIYDSSGKLDNKMVNAIDTIINEQYRKSDAYKNVLARNREMYGYSDLMSGKMSGDEARYIYSLARKSIGSEKSLKGVTDEAERKVIMAENEKIRAQNAEIYAARDKLNKEGGLFISGLSGSAQMNVGSIARRQAALSSYDVDQYTANTAKESTFNSLADYDEMVNGLRDKGKKAKDAVADKLGGLGAIIGSVFSKPAGAIMDVFGRVKESGAASRIKDHLGKYTDKAVEMGRRAHDRAMSQADEYKRKIEEELKRKEAARMSEFGGSAGPSIPPSSISTGGAVPFRPVAKTVAESILGAPSPESASSGVSAQSDTLSSILEQITGWRGEQAEWRKTVSEEHGLIFDAAAQIDETIRGLKLVSGDTEFTASVAPASKRESKWKTVGRGLGAGIKNVGKAYTRIYGAALRGAGTAISGIAGAASNMFNKVSSAAAGVAKWATHKEDYVDVYVKGKEGGMPLVSARKQRDPDEGIFFKSTGKRVMKSADIDQVCVDKSGNIVISEEDLKAGLVMNNSSPIGKLGAGLLSLGKSYLGVYGKALTAIGGVAKTALKVMFGAKERYVDVYRKDEILKGPLVTARKQREEGVFFFESGKRVDRTSDIHEPICDAEKKILVSKEDIEHGLVDVNNKPLGSGGGGLVGAMMPGLRKLGGILGAGAKSAAGIYGTAYKGLLDIGIGGIKGAGKFISRALGLDFSKGEGIGDGEQTVSILQKMQQDLALIADQYRGKKNSLDKDGDGDIDGSYADQMEKRQASDGKRFDAADMHVDVDWSKKEEAGGPGGEGEEGGFGIGDLINKVPGKWGRKLRKWTNGRALKKVMGRKAATLGRGLMRAGGTAGRFLGRHAVSLGARALPMLGSVGSAIGSALGTAGSAIGGLASSAGTALSGMLGGGGLAGLGSTLAAAAGPAALAALAGYGIYRGVKGFGKENALKNVGESAGISRTNQLTFEDRMASALGMNTKFGAKMMKAGMSINPLVGLIKGIRGNDNPLTDKEIEQCRAKLNRKIQKGLPGYDRILQEFDKAVEAGNWMRARQLSGKEADGVIASLWKHSITGKLATGTFHLLFGNNNKEMTPAEIDKIHAKYNSIIRRGGPAAKSAQRLLDKFDDYVAEGDWKRAREIAGSQFQSKGLVGSIASGIKSFFVADKDKPMTESEVKQARTRLQKLANGGNKAAQKILDQFDEAVTELNWKKARKLIGSETMSGLQALGKGLGTTAKWITRIGTLGISTLFESDQDTPMTEGEIKKFTDKMNYMISKNRDKTAQRKLERFEEYVAKQQWAKARKLAKEPHKTLLHKATSAVFDWAIGSDDKEMTEQEISKFRESMNRKIKLGGGIGKMAQKKMDAFDDAVGMQNWRKARLIAGSPNDGLLTRAAKSIGRGAANSFRFFFGGDGQPMSAAEIDQARKEMGWAISEGKQGAQKRLDLFDDYVADEKWNKARRLAKMPYKNALSRMASSVGDFLFGNDKDALSPAEINKYRNEMEQKIADAPDGQKGKLKKLLSNFNDAIEKENWPRARKISKIKPEGAIDKAMKAINPFNWFKDTYEDCMDLREKIDEKITDTDDPSGLLNKGLDAFDLMVRRQQYGDAMDLGKDILNLKPHELATKHGFSSEAYEKIAAQANEMMEKIGKAQNETSSWRHPIKSMQLSGLMKSVRDGSDQWGDEFFQETDEQLSNIMGTPEYTPKHLRPDDTIFKRGEELLKTIDEVDNNRSWLGSPVIKSRLGDLRQEVKSDPSVWDNETIDEWYDRLGEIDKDYTGGRKGATKESAALEKRGLELIKSIRASNDKFGWFRNAKIKSQLNDLENEVASSKSEWNEGSFADWESRLQELDKEYKPKSLQKQDEATTNEAVGDIEEKFGKEATPDQIQAFHDAVAPKTLDAINSDFYTEADLATKPWLRNVEIPGYPLSERKAYMKYEARKEAATKKLEDELNPFKLTKPLTPPALNYDANSTVNAVPSSVNILPASQFSEFENAFAKGGFVKRFDGGGFTENLKNRGAAISEGVVNAALAPIAGTAIGIAVTAIVPTLMVMLGPALMPLIGALTSTVVVKAWDEGDYLTVATTLLTAGISPAIIVAFFGLLGVGGALVGTSIATASAVGGGMALLKGINRGLLPKFCQDQVDSAIDGLGNVFGSVLGAGLKAATTPLTALWKMGKGAVTGDFERSEYIRDGESTLDTVLNAPHRAIDNAAGWLGAGLNKVGSSISNVFASGGFAGKPTSRLDSSGRPILYGESGTEAIIPLSNRPGNLLSRIGTKLGQLMRGRDIGPTATTADEASVHASDAKSEPLTNYLAKNLFSAAGGIGRNMLGLPGRLNRIGAATQDLIKTNPIGGMLDRVSSASQIARNRVKDMLFGRTSSVTAVDNVVPMDKPEPITQPSAAQAGTSTAPVKLEGSDQIVRVNQEVAEQIKTLSKSTEELHKLIGLILSKEGIKVQGIDLLTQVVATTGSAPRAEGGNTTIIQMVPQESGIDLRKRQM